MINGISCSNTFSQQSNTCVCVSTTTKNNCWLQFHFVDLNTGWFISYVDFLIFNSVIISSYISSLSLQFISLFAKFSTTASRNDANQILLSSIKECTYIFETHCSRLLTDQYPLSSKCLQYPESYLCLCLQNTCLIYIYWLLI